MSLVFAAVLLAQNNGPSPATVNAIMQETQARIATINTLLDAMNRRDLKAFKALGGDKIAFSADPEATFTAVMGPRTPRLAIDSFAGFATCKAGSPQSTAVDWWTVTWTCPAGARNADFQFSFKFTGRNLVAVQAARRAPKVKI